MLVKKVKTKDLLNLLSNDVSKDFYQDVIVILYMNTLTDSQEYIDESLTDNVKEFAKHTYAKGTSLERELLQKIGLSPNVHYKIGTRFKVKTLGDNIYRIVLTKDIYMATILNETTNIILNRGIEYENINYITFNELNQLINVDINNIIVLPN